MIQTAVRPHPKQPAPPAPVKAELTASEVEEDGTYGALDGQVDGRAAHLEMSREPHYVKVGGLTIETDPTYAVKGNFGGTAVALSVQPEKQIADIGGLKVQTGTVYHVGGTIGSEEIHLDVTSESHVADVGGLKIETGTTIHLDGDSRHLAVDRTVETAKVGNGVSVETGEWWVASGKSGASDVSVRLDGLRAEDRTLTGTAPAEDVALLAALQPFITA